MSTASQDPIGKVISIDDVSCLALVEVSAAVCARCASGKGCGAGLLGSGRQTRRVTASVTEALSLQRGDTVQLSLSPGNLLHASLMVYGAPLLGALLGALSAYQLQLTDLGAALSALLGLGLGVTAARLASARQVCAASYRPSVEARLDDATGNVSTESAIAEV